MSQATGCREEDLCWLLHVHGRTYRRNKLMICYRVSNCCVHWILSVIIFIQEIHGIHQYGLLRMFYKMAQLTCRYAFKNLAKWKISCLFLIFWFWVICICIGRFFEEGFDWLFCLYIAISLMQFVLFCIRIRWFARINQILFCVGGVFAVCVGAVARQLDTILIGGIMLIFLLLLSQELSRNRGNQETRGQARR